MSTLESWFLLAMASRRKKGAYLRPLITAPDSIPAASSPWIQATSQRTQELEKITALARQDMEASQPYTSFSSQGGNWRWNYGEDGFFQGSNGFCLWSRRHQRNTESETAGMMVLMAGMSAQLNGIRHLLDQQSRQMMRLMGNNSQQASLQALLLELIKVQKTSSPQEMLNLPLPEPYTLSWVQKNYKKEVLNGQSRPKVWVDTTDNTGRLDSSETVAECQIYKDPVVTKQGTGSVRTVQDSHYRNYGGSSQDNRNEVNRESQHIKQKHLQISSKYRGIENQKYLGPSRPITQDKKLTDSEINWVKRMLESAESLQKFEYELKLRWLLPEIKVRSSPSKKASARKFKDHSSSLQRKSLTGTCMKTAGQSHASHLKAQKHGQGTALKSGRQDQTSPSKAAKQAPLKTSRRGQGSPVKTPRQGYVSASALHTSTQPMHASKHSCVTEYANVQMENQWGNIKANHINEADSFKHQSPQERLVDMLVDEAIADIAKELFCFCDEFVDHLYSSEFMDQNNT